MICGEPIPWPISLAKQPKRKKKKKKKNFHMHAISFQYGGDDVSFICVAIRDVLALLLLPLCPSCMYSRLVGPKRTKFTLLRLPKAATSKK